MSACPRVFYSHSYNQVLTVPIVTGLVHFQVGARVCVSMTASSPLSPTPTPSPHPHSLAPSPTPTPGPGPHPYSPLLPSPFPGSHLYPQSRMCSLLFLGRSNVGQGAEHSSAIVASAPGDGTEESERKATTADTTLLGRTNSENLDSRSFPLLVVWTASNLSCHRVLFPIMAISCGDFLKPLFPQIVVSYNGRLLAHLFS